MMMMDDYLARGWVTTVQALDAGADVAGGLGGGCGDGGADRVRRRVVGRREGARTMTELPPGAVMAAHPATTAKENGR